MPPLGTDISHLFVNASSRLAHGIHNLNSSIRLFGRSWHCTQLNNLQNSNSSSNTILNNDIEQPNNSVNPPINEQTTNESQNTSATNLPTSSNIQSIPSLRSNHRRHLGRDRFRNVYSHHNGLLSMRTLDKDRNVLAAILSIVVIAIMATALAQPKWFSIYNDMCSSQSDLNLAKSDNNGKGVNVNDDLIFKLPSSFRHQSINAKPFHSFYSSYPVTPMTIYGLTADKGCTTPQILALKRTIIGLCFLTIMCNLIQFFMDTMGTKRKLVNSMRIFAVGNIISVLLCALIIGLCYFVSILYERVQLHRLFRKPGLLVKHNFAREPQLSSQFDILTIYQVEVKFELSYYLVTLAGFLSILAAAANLFRRPRLIFVERINDFNHSRSRFRTNADQNTLLSSDVLNNESSNYFSYYSPNGWMFNPNWNLFYNNVGATNSNNVDNNSTRQSNFSSFLPPISRCPPPPPYSP